MLSTARILSRQAKISARLPAGLFFSRHHSTGPDRTNFEADLNKLADAFEASAEAIKATLKETEDIKARIGELRKELSESEKRAYSLDELLYRIKKIIPAFSKKIEDLYEGVLYVDGELSTLENKLNKLIEKKNAELKALFKKLTRQDKIIIQQRRDLVKLQKRQDKIIIKQRRDIDKLQKRFMFLFAFTFITLGINIAGTFYIFIAITPLIEKLEKIKPKITQIEKMIALKAKIREAFMLAIEKEIGRLEKKQARSLPLLGMFSRYDSHTNAIQTLKKIEKNYDNFDLDLIVAEITAVNEESRRWYYFSPLEKEDEEFGMDWINKLQTEDVVLESVGDRLSASRA